MRVRLLETTIDSGSGVRRSLFILAAFGAGLVLGRQLTSVPAAAWFGLACGACAGVVFVRGRACAVGLAAAVVLFGAGWFSFRIYEAPVDGLGRHLAGAAWGGGGAVLTVEGVVAERPRLWKQDDSDPLAKFAFGGDGASFLFEVERGLGEDIEVPVVGALLVMTDPEVVRDIRTGDRLRVTGLGSGVRAARNPGRTDPRLWAAQRGVAGVLRVNNVDLIERLEPDGALRYRLSDLRQRAHEILHEQVLPDDDRHTRGRALLGALILGEKEPELRDVRSAFARLGLAHLMAISGFHLVAMALAALFVLRLTGDRGWVEPAIVAGLVVLYMCIVPARAPIVRAGVMLVVLLACEGAGRRYDRLGVLGWVAVGMLLWRPLDLWSLGFQLSFGITALLMWRTGPIIEKITGPRLKGVIVQPKGPGRIALEFVLKRIGVVSVVTLMAWAVSMPLVMHRIGIVPTASVLTTLVTLPLIVAMLWLGYLAIAAGVFFPAIGGAIGRVLDPLAGATVWVVESLDAIPGTSLLVPRVSALWAVVATLVVLRFMWTMRVRDRKGWAFFGLAVVWLGVELVGTTRLPRSTVARIDTVSVGDGTCHLVRSGAEALLWDCGSLRPGIGRDEVPRAIRALGGYRVRTAVVTHPNFDHYSGLPDVVEPLGIKTVLLGQLFLDEAQARPWGPEAIVLQLLAEKGVEVRAITAGETFKIGSMTCSIIWPEEGATFASNNDSSLIGRFDVETREGVRTILLTGDIQKHAIEGLLSSQPELHADILELPHHGSAHEAAYEFVMRVDPDVVLQSTGPSRAGDSRWAPFSKGRAWYNTAVHGAAWAEIHTDGSLRSGALHAREVEMR